MKIQQPEDKDRLSRIVTRWTMLRQAHTLSGDVSAVEQARRLLMERYCTAAYRYLVGALRDEDAAGDLFQEFALRFLRGDFRNIRPERGRFRDYLRTVLINLVTDHYRSRRRQPLPLTQDVPAPPSEFSGNDIDDNDFIESWRREMMDHAWRELQSASPTSHGVLLFHVQNPTSTSAQAAKVLSKQAGNVMTAQHVRVALHRARQRFADALLREVATSLDHPSADELREELASLRLETVCDKALERWSKRTSTPTTAES